MRTGATGSCCYLFYAYSHSHEMGQLLLFVEIDLFKFVPCDRGADLGRLLAKLCLLICEKAFFSAGGAFRSVQAFKTTAQARVAQRAITPAITWQLIHHAADLNNLLIHVLLPRVSEIFSREFRT